MLRLHIVNPNTTASMMQGITQAARAAAPSDVEIMATQPDFGPASIEGFLDRGFLRRCLRGAGMLARIWKRHQPSLEFTEICSDELARRGRRL